MVTWCRDKAEPAPSTPTCANADEGSQNVSFDEERKEFRKLHPGMMKPE